MNTMRRILAIGTAGLICGCADPSAGGSSTTGNALGARVVRSDGTAGSGDTVALRSDVADSVIAPFAIALGDAQGNVRFEHVPDGRWTLEARGERQGRLVRLRLARDSIGLELRTGDYATLWGQVRTAGVGANGTAMLAGTSQTAAIAPDGSFEFERVSPGDQRTLATPSSKAATGTAVWSDLVIAPGAVETLSIIAPTKARSGEWALAWTDDFRSFDSSRWNIDTGNGCTDGLCGWGKNALQSFATENVSIRNGELVLRADSVAGSWKSGQVQTRGKVQFRYGRLEIDAILPGDEGAWSLISLQGDSTGRVWPSAGAMDVASLWGFRSDSLMGIAHRTNPDGTENHPGTSFGSAQGWAGRKVTFAMEWSPTDLVWLADDKAFFHVAGGTPFDHSFYLSIGLTVGGDGNAAPQNGTSFELVVQQVRLYQRTP